MAPGEVGTVSPWVAAVAGEEGPSSRPLISVHPAPHQVCQSHLTEGLRKKFLRKGNGFFGFFGYFCSLNETIL